MVGSKDLHAVVDMGRYVTNQLTLYIYYADTRTQSTEY